MLLRLSYFEKIGDSRRTDRLTGGRGATLIAAPRDGRIIINAHDVHQLELESFQMQSINSFVEKAE